MPSSAPPPAARRRREARRTQPGARGRDELIEHALERSEAEREMALAFLEVDRGPGDPRSEGFAMGERHHQISVSLPDHDRARELIEVESPWFGEGQVVIHP